MARTEITGGEGSTRGRTVRRGREEGGKYARYTEEQIEVLEKVYTECSNPNHVQRARIMREEPVLRGVDSKQLKVWFQNRRCRERQKRENGDLLSENKRLASSNKLLREENDVLQKKLDRLICENEHLRNQVLSFTSTVTTFDMSRQMEANNPQLPIRIADNNNGLLSLAEETKKEFLSKADGTAINWIPVPWLKMHSPSSVGAFYVASYNCTGVAARACATISFEPSKAIEILKDRRSWSRHCRNMDVVAKHPANNGGSIELICTQYYAPTTLACARDFWTLRYTCGLDDGSFVVCERSISGSDAGLSSPVALEFVRGMMLASGYLIRPAEGGSTIYMVDHLDLEASSVPEVIRPLYVSSELVAKKMIVSALHYIEHVDNEMNGRITRQASNDDPALMRSFSEKLYRGFNDAVNCFSEDGWTLMNGAYDDVIMSIKRARQSGFRTNYDTVICVKASVLLQNVFPVRLVKYLKEHRTEWMDFNFADYSVAYSEGVSFAYPAKHTHKLEGYPVVLAKTMHEDEALEIIKFDGINRPYYWGLYHLQIDNGVEDTGFGACSELIFAPIDVNLPEDAVFLPSGFRFILLGSNTDTRFASNGTFNHTNGHAAGSHPPTMMTLAFQFPFEAHLQEEVQAMSRQYIRHVISSVRNISARMMSSGANREMNSQAAIPRGPMPARHYPERSPEVNRARQNIPGVMPLAMYSPMDPTRAYFNSMSNREFFATLPGGANTSGGIMPSAPYPVLNSIEANPAAIQSIASGMMPSGSYPRTNSAEANPAIVNNLSGGAGPSGSNPERNFTETNPASAGNISGGIMPSGSYPDVNSIEANPAMDFGSTPQSTYAANLADLIYQGYRSTLGVDMLGFNSHQNTVSSADMIQHHPYAILCFSFTSLPVCLYANQAALNMLETTIDSLPTLTVDRILDGIHNLSLFSVMPTVMNQGYSILPPGQYLSANNHIVSYEQAVIWKVHSPDGSIHSFALACINWSFII